jgi:ribosome-associated protein
MNRKTRIQPIEPAAATESDGSEYGYDRPSKSQLKRDMLALQVLGVALIELPKEALKRMPMPEKLDDAVRDARRITDHEGRRRQLQYVGRVMRSYLGVNRAETAKMHWIERTREKLLADDTALTEFIREHPGVDPQEGRTLIRNARKEREQAKPPRYFRELFQWIKAAAGVEDEENEPEVPQDPDEDD